MADHIDPLERAASAPWRGSGNQARLPPETLRRLRTLDAPAILVDEWVTVKRISEDVAQSRNGVAFVGRQNLV